MKIDIKEEDNITGQVVNFKGDIDKIIIEKYGNCGSIEIEASGSIENALGNYTMSIGFKIPSKTCEEIFSFIYQKIEANRIEVRESKSTS